MAKTSHSCYKFFWEETKKHKLPQSKIINETFSSSNWEDSYYIIYGIYDLSGAESYQYWSILNFLTTSAHSFMTGSTISQTVY